MIYKINCYCDGSCYYKTKQGGIGVYITDGIKEWYISEGFEPTTISRMEGLAVLKAIQFINPNGRGVVRIYSDSEYIIKSFTENRLAKWHMIGFEGIKNVDMWKALIKAIQNRPKIDFKFKHIGGHQDDLSNDHVFGNNVADLLANYKNKKYYGNDKEAFAS